MALWELKGLILPKSTSFGLIDIGVKKMLYQMKSGLMIETTAKSNSGKSAK